MKVLVVTESYWPNADGGALFERRLVLGLITRGHTANVWAPGTRLRSYLEIDGPYNIYRERAVTFLANRKYKVSLWPFWHARKVIRYERPDVIHIHNCYLMGLAAMFWARYYRIPVVATNHFMPENALLNVKLPELLNRPAERLIWAFLVWFHNRANVVTSPTPTAMKLLVDHGLHVPSEAITNGIDTAVFKPRPASMQLATKLGLATDHPIILYVGRLDGEKRLDLLIAAMPAVLKKQRCALVFAGYGKAMKDLQAQATGLGIDHAVTFTGYLDEADKPALYNLATIFVIPSPAELQSIVTLEAMASGLPVIATDVAALAELCHDGSNGLLFARDDVAGLANCIQKLLADPGLRKRFGAESTKLIRASHATGVTFDSYISAYEAAVTLRQRP